MYVSVLHSVLGWSVQVVTVSWCVQKVDDRWFPTRWSRRNDRRCDFRLRVYFIRSVHSHEDDPCRTWQVQEGHRDTHDSRESLSTYERALQNTWVTRLVYFGFVRSILWGFYLLDFKWKRFFLLVFLIMIICHAVGNKQEGACTLIPTPSLLSG